MKLQGRAWVFGDNITTDDIIAGKYKHFTIDPDKLVLHLMENIRPGFHLAIRANDFIVAGENFGCGSSREQAPQIIKTAGISAVIAKSFARIFFRNAINIGLRLVVCDTYTIREGDSLELDTEEGCLSLVNSRKTWRIPPMDPVIDKIIDCGGLLNYVRSSGGL